MADYGKLKVTELKEILKERGIPSTGLGRKQQIVEALEKFDSEAAGAADAGEVEAEVQGEEEVREAQGDGVAEANVGETEVASDSRVIGEKERADEGGLEKVEEEAAIAVPPVEETPVAESTPALGDTDPSPTIPQQEHSQPIVLEQNEPVSKEPSALSTPQLRSSPAAESVASDTRKRKRRSPTPPLSQESVNKKLKAAEAEGEIVKLPEDVETDEAAVFEEAPVAVDRTAEGTVGLPDARSDDVMQVDETTAVEASEAAVAERVEDVSRGTAPSRSRSPSRQPQKLDAQLISSRNTDAEDPDQPPTHPAIHPATRALYIRDLVRPLQPHQLRAHLISLATPPSSSPAESILELFHLDTLRTHAFAVFASLTAAARVRSALHSRVWPDEPARKALWVDFVPEEKVSEWIELEERSTGAGGKRDARRWEVVYSPAEEGEGGMEARLQEVTSGVGAGPPTGPRQMSFSGPAAPPAQTQAGQGMPNAPLGPRGRRPSIPTHQQQPPSRSPPPSNANAKPTPPPSSTSFSLLDARFPSTSTKPKLYYLPVSADLVSRRLAALAELTSASWEGEREGSFGRDTAVGEVVRRYTFEDGERVVDGGGDIGNFGRPGRGSGGGGGGGGGRGRGRR